MICLLLVFVGATLLKTGLEVGGTIGYLVAVCGVLLLIKAVERAAWSLADGLRGWRHD